MSATVVVISHTTPCHSQVAGNKNTNLSKLENFISALKSGSIVGSTVDVLANSSGTPTAASGTVTLSGASGTVGATINGKSITVTYATSDANTASLLAAAINASTDALVSGWVTASAASGVATITATQKSAWGNAITLAASGTGATASGSRLTGGAGGLGSYVSNTVG